MAPLTMSQVRDLVAQEREKALSVKEWHHRLAGYGYKALPLDDGFRIVTVSHGVEVCTLNA